jgi:4-hydroxy-3-polyprenylbenzoate decarboxylase
MRIILAITGASGAIYALRLLQVLISAGLEVHLSISKSGRAVLLQELGIAVDLDRFRADSLFDTAGLSAEKLELIETVLGAEPFAKKALGERVGQVRYWHFHDFMAPIASGSFPTGGMVICPCSGTTTSAIAHAAGGNLIQRAAEVQLKERRPLVLVPRETPLSTLQLENMHRLSQAGAVVLPAMPGWYHGVRTIRDLVDFVVARVCDQLHVPNTLITRWGSERES